jgi:CRISPR-associated protein Cas5h
MRLLKFDIKGDYAHFKIPYTNNNPLTHSFITKTALLGLMGAVLGVERKEMRGLYPILSDGLKYSVRLNGKLDKVSISQYMFNFGNLTKPRPNATPKPMEYLKNVHYTVYLILESKDNIVVEFFQNFIEYIKQGFAVWNPTLGVANCPALIEGIEIGDAEQLEGEFNTQTFVGKVIYDDTSGIIYSDRIPTHQSDDWFNDPERYIDIKFTDRGGMLKSSGSYYRYREENLFAV